MDPIGVIVSVIDLHQCENDRQLKSFIIEYLFNVWKLIEHESEGILHWTHKSASSDKRGWIYQARFSISVPPHPPFSHRVPLTPPRGSAGNVIKNSTRFAANGTRGRIFFYSCFRNLFGSSKGFRKVLGS